MVLGDFGGGLWEWVPWWGDRDDGGDGDFGFLLDCGSGFLRFSSSSLLLPLSFSQHLLHISYMLWDLLIRNPALFFFLSYLHSHSSGCKAAFFSFSLSFFFFFHYVKNVHTTTSLKFKIPPSMAVAFLATFIYTNHIVFPLFVSMSAAEEAEVASAMPVDPAPAEPAIAETQP
ncbi:hypothetical protein MRB53_013236 [Persea americana]|uniref:Uncharacterized protein n=1 Tax=Persea americana TaxID=3435 RepID=A0ACC2K7D7_PERAE|nr:hypothetical protein MRB53_013236 [Persea americana]